MFSFLFFFHFLICKEKAIFLVSIVRNDNNTQDDDDDELDAIYHTRTTMPQKEQSKWLKSENWRNAADGVCVCVWERVQLWVFSASKKHILELIACFGTFASIQVILILYSFE